MNSMGSRKEEKRILWLMHAIILLAFSIIALYTKDSMALLLGVFTSVLTSYSHFIISKYYPDGDKYLLVLSAFLAEFGIVVLYRIKPYYAIRQSTWFAIGMSLFILIVVLLPDIEKLRNLKYLYMAAEIGLLLMTQFFGVDRKGSRNWIDLGFTSFQPSEFAKIFLVLYLASALKDFKNRKDLILPSAVVGISLILLVLQKDLGAAFIFFLIAVTMLYIATNRFHYVLASVLLFLVGATASYYIFPHVRARVAIWLNPWADPSNNGYQIIQSLYAIASGGFVGTGLFMGHPDYIPEVQTDFIFSIICEEFGLLGGFAIIIIFFLIVYRGFRAAIKADATFSRLVAVGFSTMIGAQAFTIIGGVTKMIPLTGITLPLVSYGGSSMVIIFAAMGMLQKISEAGVQN